MLWAKKTWEASQDKAFGEIEFHASEGTTELLQYLTRLRMQRASLRLRAKFGEPWLNRTIG